MGEKQLFQPLTREDRLTVILYRAGIVLSAILVGCFAWLGATPAAGSNRIADILGFGLQAAVGMSAVCIHLYMSTFKRYLRNLYLVSLACFAVLLFLGKGSPADALAQTPLRTILLLPLAGCLGFVTAKEAFCFRLVEGYVLAMLMPFYLLLVSVGALQGKGASSGLIAIALLLLLFTSRKAFMPLAYDIGDKSAYR